MDEKDVTFNLFIDESGRNKMINISSDIDDSIDYLEVDEKVCIITELIGQICKQIISEVYEDDDTVDYNENDKYQNKVRNDLYELTRELVYIIINSVNNICRAKFNQTPEILEYSMATYNPEDIDNDVVNSVKDTFHSDEVHTLDPLKASFNLIIDTITCMLRENGDKNTIKSTIDKSLNYMLIDLHNIIDEF